MPLLPKIGEQKHSIQAHQKRVRAPQKACPKCGKMLQKEQ